MTGFNHDFENGTTQGWTVGNPQTHQNPPTNVSTGGPGGTDDNYLRIQATGVGNAGSRLAVINTTPPATGDYTGQTTVTASMINEGDEEVVMRVGF